MPPLHRRRFLLGLAATPLASAATGVEAAGGDRVGQALTPWRPGTLDIHHLSTGRGDCALVIGPDGTSLMIDAGATANPVTVSTPPRPNGRLRPGQWIARYARRHLPGPSPRLDYFVASHIHPDHIGDPADCPLEAGGQYRLTGLSDVAQGLPIGTVFDRGWPDYDYPAPQTAPFAANYIAFLRARARAGLQNARLEPGRADQLIPIRTPGRWPGFEVRVLARDGRVWTGRGDEAAETFPPLSTLPAADRPTENMCSVALRISYARFRYFTGGDLTADTFDGALPWADIEGAAARACGPADVAVAPHHGYFDAVGAAAVAALRPRIWIVPAWHVTHPDMKPLERMLSERLYGGPRSIYLTQATPEALRVGERFLARASSTSGHVVVRVDPDGAYRVVVTDSWSEQDKVLQVNGSYSPASFR